MARKLKRWEYSFILHTCNLSEKKIRRGQNPLTGEPVEFFLDDGLTSEEITAIRHVLGESGFEGPEPDYEGYARYGAGDDSLRFRGCDLQASDPISSIAAEVVVKDLADDVLKIILAVARAGNLALMSFTGDSVRIVDRAPSEKLVKRWPDARSLSSIAELREWLQSTIGGRQVVVPLH